MTCLAYYRTIALALLVAACGPKTNDSDTNAATDTDATTDANTTDANTTDANTSTDADTSNAADNASTNANTTTGYDDTTVGSFGTTGYDETYGTQTGGPGCLDESLVDGSGCWYHVVSGDEACCAAATMLTCGSDPLCPPVTVCELCDPGEQVDVDAAVCVLSAMQQRAVATHELVDPGFGTITTYEVLADESVLYRNRVVNDSICIFSELVGQLHEPSYYEACIANQDDEAALLSCMNVLFDADACAASPPACE